MAKSNKTKRYWLGLVTTIYAFFLVCQGIWTYINYLFIYLAIYFMIPGYDYKWIYTEMYFTQALVLITPIAGGLILMGVGYWLMFREGNLRNIGQALFFWFTLLSFFFKHYGCCLAIPIFGMKYSAMQALTSLLISPDSSYCLV